MRTEPLHGSPCALPAGILPPFLPLPLLFSLFLSTHTDHACRGRMKGPRVSRHSIKPPCGSSSSSSIHPHLFPFHPLITHLERLLRPPPLPSSLCRESRPLASSVRTLEDLEATYFREFKSISTGICRERKGSGCDVCGNQNGIHESDQILTAGRNASGSVVDRAGIERHGSGQKRNGKDDDKIYDANTNRANNTRHSSSFAFSTAHATVLDFSGSSRPISKRIADGHRTSSLPPPSSSHWLSLSAPSHRPAPPNRPRRHPRPPLLSPQGCELRDNVRRWSRQGFIRFQLGWPARGDPICSQPPCLLARSQKENKKPHHEFEM